MVFKSTYNYLIIDILSTASIKHDKITKRLVYERVGVKEYFIVDPSSKEVITYYLKNNILKN